MHACDCNLHTRHIRRYKLQTRRILYICGWHMQNETRCRCKCIICAENELGTGMMRVMHDLTQESSCSPYSVFLCGQMSSKRQRPLQCIPLILSYSAFCPLFGSSLYTDLFDVFEVLFTTFFPITAVQNCLGQFTCALGKVQNEKV